MDLLDALEETAIVEEPVSALSGPSIALHVKPVLYPSSAATGAVLGSAEDASGAAGGSFSNDAQQGERHRTGGPADNGDEQRRASYPESMSPSIGLASGSRDDAADSVEPASLRSSLDGICSDTRRLRGGPAGASATTMADSAAVKPAGNGPQSPGKPTRLSRLPSWLVGAWMGHREPSTSSDASAQMDASSSTVSSRASAAAAESVPMAEADPHRAGSVQSHSRNAAARSQSYQKATMVATPVAETASSTMPSSAAPAVLHSALQHQCSAPAVWTYEQCSTVAAPSGPKGSAKFSPKATSPRKSDKARKGAPAATSEGDLEMKQLESEALQLLLRVPAADQKRQNVMWEILSTELVYVRNLAVIQQIFMQPLEQRQILGRYEFKAIFSNVARLLPLHQALVSSMLRRRTDAALIDTIGDLFCAQVRRWWR